jgi:hypothetical protein
MKSRRHPVRRRRETDPNKGTTVASVIASHPVASRTLSEVPDGTTPTVNTARQTEPTYTA